MDTVIFIQYQTRMNTWANASAPAIMACAMQWLHVQVTQNALKTDGLALHTAQEMTFTRLSETIIVLTQGRQTLTAVTLTAANSFNPVTQHNNAKLEYVLLQTA